MLRSSRFGTGTWRRRLTTSPRAVRHGGVNLIVAAMKQNRLDLLHEGLAKLKMENGLS